LDEITQIINSLARRDGSERGELPLMLYQELRRMASGKMLLESPGHTLQATALVHEAWMRLLKSDGTVTFENRRHFFAAAAEAMRRILVECARRKKRSKRGGGMERVNVDDIELEAPLPDQELLALDEVMDRFSAAHPKAAEVVKLYYFAGLTQSEVAEILGVSHRMVERMWAFARAWLFDAFEKTREGSL
jgi:RNA polymerase sigma factor (TIGR02999 family)